MAELEERYAVLKIADISAYLTDEEQETLDDLHRKINRHRLMDEREVLKCVVVEHDWPEYAQTLSDIERRVRQEKCEHEWLWWPVAGEGQYCPKCGARNFDCDD